MGRNSNSSGERIFRLLVAYPLFGYSLQFFVGHLVTLALAEQVRLQRLRCARGQLGGRFEVVEESAGFGEDIFGFGGGKWPAEGSLRGELGSAFGVAAD